MTKPTLEDIPQILNSISWQLKRIADAVEQEKEQSQSAPNSKTTTSHSPVIRNLMAELNRGREE